MTERNRARSALLAVNRTFSDGRVDKRIYRLDDKSLGDRTRAHFDNLVKADLLDKN